MYKPFFVGVVGFEPTTPCSQSRCANRTALYPEFYFKRTPIPWRSFLLKQEYANRLVRRSIREGVACPPKHSRRRGLSAEAFAKAWLVRRNRSLAVEAGAIPRSKKRKSPLWQFTVLAERGGFEPPVPLRVRQFSKLLVSATHPPLRAEIFYRFLKRSANIALPFLH